MMIGTGERGVALIAASMAMVLLLALGASLILVTSSDTAIARNFRNGDEGLYAATAIVERTIAELRRESDWDLLLSGTVGSAFADGPPGGGRRLADGTTIDLTQVVNLANCGTRGACSDTAMNATTAARPWGINNPRWTLYAHGLLDDLAGEPRQASSFYVLAMVADDGAENDGDPRRDGLEAPPFVNPGRNVILVRGEAFGPRGAHRVVEATLHRYRSDALDPASPVRLRVRTWWEF